MRSLCLWLAILLTDVQASMKWENRHRFQQFDLQSRRFQGLRGGTHGPQEEDSLQVKRQKLQGGRATGWSKQGKRTIINGKPHKRPSRQKQSKTEKAPKKQQASKHRNTTKRGRRPRLTSRRLRGVA